MNGLKPFEGDTFIPEEIKRLRERFSLTTCVETGTQYGMSTLELARWFDRVFTIELDFGLHDFFGFIKSRFDPEGRITAFRGDTVDTLPEVLRHAGRKNIFFFLDAHGGERCPLKTELQIIINHRVENCAIAIHDFRVPGRDFGYDSYDYELCWDQVEWALPKIFPHGYAYHYNQEANGSYRGIIYIYPR